LPSASSPAGTVVEPASIEEAAQLFERAAREGAKVSIERDGGELVLTTRRLNRLLEHEAGDLTATVEPGISIPALNDRLQAHGQMLALDPPGGPTVGAALAGDLFGPRAFRYGRPRDLVLGVTVVLPDGTVANAGGKVVKNVAGYDLGKLFCGSRGRLGLIARASLRLHPRPATTKTVVAEVAGPEDAQRVARELLHSQLVPSAADLLWSPEGSRLAVLFEGGEGAVAAQTERARALFGGSEDDGVWAEVERAQLAAGGRRSFAAGSLAAELAGMERALVRLGPVCFAYVPGAAAVEPSPLVERVRAQFDPEGVLA
jgi:glycolate oxidase FAD binding subunit